ncbi:MAG: hypothetical protein LBJ46_05675 [Planctomycetota bacterium]|jgi:hypothetical protein|nr:hypothetical protein [Planctomycetota bacterium]
MEIRTFWDGGDYSPLVKNSPILVKDAHICIVTHITKSELDTLFQTVNMTNGLGNRFLWLCARRTILVPNPRPMLVEALSDLQRRLWRLVIKAQKLREVPLTDAACALWSDVYHELSVERQGLVGVVTSRSEA